MFWTWQHRHMPRKQAGLWSVTQIPDREVRSFLNNLSKTPETARTMIFTVWDFCVKRPPTVA